MEIRKFLVKSMEKSIFPHCQSDLRVIGSRKRNLICEDGTKIILVVRRLRCKNELCNKIHHELPNIIIPYKRHTTMTYERAIEGTDHIAPVENSTLKRIRAWFKARADALIGGLLGTYVIVTNDFAVGLSNLPQSILKRIRYFVGPDEGWLKRVVHIHVNNNKW